MILKNGKRLDGCSDTVPVGTLNPFLGSVAPYGYLICAGQLVSKTTYKELYEICGDSFGEGTTTEFRLPDLRGKTITGYKEGDTTFGTLGGLIGELTHAHEYGITYQAHDGVILGDNSLGVDIIGVYNNGVKKSAIISDKTSTKTLPFASDSRSSTTYTYSAKANTTESSNLQPSINMNWIVKAFLLMPNQSYVENSLTSTSTINSLSAAKGKELKNLIDAKYPFEGASTSDLNNIVSPIYRSTTNPTDLPSGLGANACMVFNSTANSQYVGQLAFSFGNNSLALRRRYGSTTWTDWTYLNFDAVNNHIKNIGGCTLAGVSAADVTYPSTAWGMMKYSGLTKATNSNTSLFSTSDGSIKILKAGYYCVNATLEGSYERSASIAIYKNSSQIGPIVDGGAVSGMYNITIPSFVFYADANDVISLYTRCDTASASILIRSERSFMTVMTI